MLETQTLTQLYKYRVALNGVTGLAGALSHRLKARRFDSWSGDMPRLSVQFSVGVRERGN